MQVPFSWPGSKMKHLDKVLPLIPYTDRFIDVFGGSGSVILNTPFHALDVFNDINSHVANFYTVLQNKEMMEDLIWRLEISVHSRELFDLYKERLKEGGLKPVEEAHMWYYVIQTSFARLGRHYGRNMKESFETKRVYERIPCFEDVHKRLRHCYIENKNAFTIMKEYDQRDTVFYMDPPYINTPVGTYTGFKKFTEEDHQKLLSTIFSLEGVVVLSGEPNELYDSYPWDEKKEWATNAHIDTDRSGGRTECLWVKR